jgi:AcrR family transcriptional regulator
MRFVARDHKAALLEAAIDCLLEKGYARTTARDIVAAADSHLPSINYYYGSKDRLMGEAFTELIRRWVEEIHDLSAETRTSDPLERLSALTAQMFDTYERNRTVLVGFIEALAQAERSPELRAQLADAYQGLRLSLAEVAAELVGSGDGSDDQAMALASLLMAYGDGLMIQWLLDPEATPRDEALLGAVDATVRGHRRGAAERAR